MLQLSDRFELLVAYSTDTTVDGTTVQGGMDVVSSLYWYDEIVALARMESHQSILLISPEGLLLNP